MQNTPSSLITAIDDFCRLSGIMSSVTDTGLTPRQDPAKVGSVDLSSYSDILTQSALRDNKLQCLLVPVYRPVVESPEKGPSKLFADMLKHNWSIVRAWREHLGISPTVAAARLGIPGVQYANIEQVGASVDEAILKNIARDLTSVSVA